MNRSKRVKRRMLRPHKRAAKYVQESTCEDAGNNSFLLKGWSVTVVGGLLAFSFKELQCLYIVISLLVLFFFWLLDGYYLSPERAFVKLYDHVRAIDAAKIDFSMDTKSFRHGISWLRCAFSKTVALFYGGLLVVQNFL